MTGITTRIFLVLAATLAVMAVVAGLYSLIYDRGVRDTTDTITRQNQEAGNAADSARSRFDAGCADGLRFDFATGKCTGAAFGRGN